MGKLISTVEIFFRAWVYGAKLSNRMHVTYRVADWGIRHVCANLALPRFDDRAIIIRPGDAEIRGVAVRAGRPHSPLLCAPGPPGIGTPPTSGLIPCPNLGFPGQLTRAEKHGPRFRASAKISGAFAIIEATPASSVIRILPERT